MEHPVGRTQQRCSGHEPRAQRPRGNHRQRSVPWGARCHAAPTVESGSRSILGEDEPRRRVPLGATIRSGRHVRGRQSTVRIGPTRRRPRARRADKPECDRRLRVAGGRNRQLARACLPARRPRQQHRGGRGSNGRRRGSRRNPGSGTVHAGGTTEAPDEAAGSRPAIVPGEVRERCPTSLVAIDRGTRIEGVRRTPGRGRRFRGNCRCVCVPRDAGCGHRSDAFGGAASTCS